VNTENHEVELPPGDPQPLDCEVFASLVRSCIERTIACLKDLPIPQRPTVVYRQLGLGAEEVSLLGPHYRDPEILARVDQDWRSAEVSELLTYLWDRAALKVIYFGSAPREAWENLVFNYLVVMPMLAVLKESAIESLVDHGTAVAWAVDPDVLRRAARRLAEWYCLPNPLVTAYCPIQGIDMPPDLPLQVDGLTLRVWNPRDRMVFRSIHATEFMWDDLKAPTLTQTIAEVQLPIDLPPVRRAMGIGGANLRLPDLKEYLDLLKWAIVIALDIDHPPAEGTCLIMARSEQVGRIRRDENGSGPNVLSGESIRRCVDLISEFRTAVGYWKDGDLERGLWHFGRACVAVPYRDILLESVIGLDSLLVPGGGEARYRFRLHGAAILSPLLSSPENLSKELDEIYMERSLASHGREPRASQLGLRALKFLAKAIESIIRLTLDESLDPRDGSVSKAIEHYVLTGASRSATNTPRQSNSR
jgi:hypothetical protein